MATLQERLAQAQASDIGNLQQRLAKAQAVVPDPTGLPGFAKSVSQFGKGVGLSAANTLLQLPKLPGQAVAAARTGVQGLASLATGGDADFAGRFEKTKGEFPANLLLKAPTASVQEIEAAFKTAKDFQGTTFDEELARINERVEGRRERFPIASTLGDVGGDVLSIMGGRLPFLSKIGKAEKFLAGKKFADAIRNPGLAGEFGNVAKKVADSAGMRSLLRGAGRATEAGLEAAVLEALKGDDPLRAAAYVAGGQAVGSAMVKAGQGLISGGPMKIGAKLALTASAYFGLLQTLKEGTPGGDDNPLETVSDSFEHIMLLLAAGGVAGAMGAGRIRPADAAKYPRLAEFFSTLPRAMMISLVTDYVEAPPEEKKLIDATLSQLQKDPDFFGDEVSEKLLKAMEAGNITEALRTQLQ